VDGKISSSSGKETKVSFGIHALSQKEKRKNALKALGICWGMMLITLPLPPIHWVTVPGLFLFGIYSFFRKLRQTEDFETAQLSCPECGASFPLDRQPVQNPLAFVCPHCRYGLKLSW
jgi:hypothetical protein